jgi:acetoin utilization protein AcuB
MPQWRKIMDFILKNYMTPSPHTIGADQELKFAENLMKDLKIRHLPVLKEKELMGILSLRDIRLLQGIQHDYEKVKVEEVCVEDPITFQVEDDIRKVAQTMSSKKIGSVVVLDHEKLVGIFTWIDALEALGKVK